MHRFTVAALAGGLFALVGLAVSVAGSGGPWFETDHSSYESAEHAEVSVHGLTSCAGREVELGFFSEPELPWLNFRTQPVAVDAAGSATTTIFMATNTTWPGARGDCVPGGFLRAPHPVVVTSQPVPASFRILIRDDGTEVLISGGPVFIGAGGAGLEDAEGFVAFREAHRPWWREHVGWLAASVCVFALAAAVWLRYRQSPDAGL
jgi:hypothetical protein